MPQDRTNTGVKLSYNRLAVVFMAAASAAALAVLDGAALWEKFLSAFFVTLTLLASIWVWRTQRERMGRLTTVALIALLWAAILFAVGFVASAGSLADRARDGTTYGAGGALMVSAWAVLVMPLRGVWGVGRRVRKRLRDRRQTTMHGHEKSHQKEHSGRDNDAIKRKRKAQRQARKKGRR